MEATRKKASIVAGALFALLALFTLINLYRSLDASTLISFFRRAIRPSLNGTFPLFNLLEIIALITASVFLFMNKKSLPLPICTGALALFSLVQLVLFLKSASGNDTPAAVVATTVLSYLLLIAIWGMLSVILLSNLLPALAPIKAKEALLGKIFLGLVIAFFVFALVQGFLAYRTVGYRGKVKLDTKNLLPYLGRTLLKLAAICSMAFWYAPMPKKERPVVEYTETTYNNTYATAPLRNPCYVSLIKHVCLLLFTFGIWQFVWIYKTTKFSNRVADEPYADPTAGLLLCMFIPFYQIYWTYKTAKRLDKIARGAGLYSELAGACLFLAFFVPFTAPILMQDKVNQIVATQG